MGLATQLKLAIRKLSGQSTAFHVRGSRLNDYGQDSVSSFRRDQTTKDTLSTCAKLFSQIPNNEPAIAAECMDHLVAGVDTTGDAMCILMWRISTPEYTHVQDKLFAELSSIKDAFDPVTRTAPIAALEKLPYLDAVIHEAMRWRPPVPMTLFRIVPPSGAVISGHAIPPNTTVGCQAYSLHRVEEVFPDPDVFDPKRWLTDDAAQLAAMRAHFWPFSSGGRMCLGHNLAMVEMKLIVAAVYMHYTTRVTPAVTEESMRMDDQLTSGVPYALSCPLEFVAR
jgi:cytochrome P450